METFIYYKKFILKGLGQGIDFKTFDKNWKFRDSSAYIYRKNEIPCCKYFRYADSLYAYYIAIITYHIWSIIN